MSFYRRRLPHFSETERPVFLTWRLVGSLPSSRHFDVRALTSGQAFVAFDRLLDEARTGPFWLRIPEVAEIVANAIGNGVLIGHYELHAFVVMPNHVHLLITPKVPIPMLMRSLKGATARRANLVLSRTGQTFWQEESYDRIVRNGAEFERIRNYIENNPVRVGLVQRPEEFRWSSAWGD